MLLAHTAAGLAEPERSGERGTCPGCHEDVVGKCGDLITWHWSHLARTDCDSWYEPMTDWHRDWQAAAPLYRREVPFGPHRADVVTCDGRIYEIQHSALSAEDLRDREEFYRGDLVWIWDAREAYADARIEVRLERERGYVGERIDRRAVKFHWPQSRRSVGLCQQTVLLDLGRWVLGVDRHNDTMSWGIGHLWEPAVVRARLATEGSIARRYPNCADKASQARLTPPADAELKIVQRRPCCICASSTMAVNPYGQAQCDQCATYATAEELTACHACGLPLLYEDAAIEGCHATCIPEAS